MKFSSIDAAIRHFSALKPEKPCLADADGVISYRKYYERICGTAAFLKEKGIRPGDRVVASAAQRIDYLVLCHAVQMIGAIFVPVEKNAGIERIHHIVRETDAALYVGNARVDLCPAADYAAFAGLKTDREPCGLPETDADSMILFTTGTTGGSKGILLTHSAEVAVAENVKCGVEMEEDNVEILPMPMNHSFALRRYFANMVNGSMAVLLDGVVFVDRLFQMMDRYRATSIAMAPSALAILLKLSGDRLGRYRRKLRYIQFGSAPLPEADKAKLLSLLPDCRLYNMYGTTEAGCACILNFNSGENYPNCIGRPTCHSVFSIVDDDGRPMRSSRENPGHIRCSGGMCMKGYYREPELTAATVKNGFVCSDDLGYADENGLIYIIGRADDVINSGGNKISPVEIEEAAGTYPDVADCACSAIPDPLLGQVPKLFVAAAGGLDTERLYQYLSTKVEKYKLPKSIEIVEKIPRTYNGKIWRSKLRTMGESAKCDKR